MAEQEYNLLRAKLTLLWLKMQFGDNHFSKDDLQSIIKAVKAFPNEHLVFLIKTVEMVIAEEEQIKAEEEELQDIAESLKGLEKYFPSDKESDTID